MKHFICPIKPISEKNIILVFDECRTHSHTLLSTLQGRMTLLCLVVTHRLRMQSLDVPFFKPLPAYLNQASGYWMRPNPQRSKPSSPLVKHTETRLQMKISRLDLPKPSYGLWSGMYFRTAVSFQIWKTHLRQLWTHCMTLWSQRRRIRRRVELIKELTMKLVKWMR